MYVIPLQCGIEQFTLLVLLVDENVERMKKYDPAHVEIPKLGAPSFECHRRLRDR